MFVLDTNVISELRKARSGKADANVAAWAATMVPGSLSISAITVMKLETGVPVVERRDARQGAILRTWLDDQVLPAFAGRVLPVDQAVAQRCASLHVPAPRADRDALIAATALVHGMRVVTRNVADFEPTGVALINPWSANALPQATTSSLNTPGSIQHQDQPIGAAVVAGQGRRPHVAPRRGECGAGARQGAGRRLKFRLRVCLKTRTTTSPVTRQPTPLTASPMAFWSICSG
jgi:predicted nucleic acid-binding protein